MSQFSKAAIDRLGKRLRDSEAPDPADVAAYIEWSATFEDPLRATLDIMDAACERAGVSLSEKTSRIKQLYSIVAKLRRGHLRLSSIDDIAGCRAVVPREADVNALVLQLATAQVKHVRDYREQARNGYRAVHMTVVSDDGKSVELQLRTEIQHVWAGLSERRAAVVDHAVKYGGGPPEEQEVLMGLSTAGRVLDLRQVELDSRRQRSELWPHEPDLTVPALMQEQEALRSEIEQFTGICDWYARRGRI